MREAGKALRNMVIWVAVIFACNFLKVLEITWLPLPENIISILYLPLFVIFLINHFENRIAERDGLKMNLLAVAWLILVFVCLREMKYNAFEGGDWFCRFLWYLYYVPILLIPVFSFFAAILINTKEKQYLPRKWSWVLIVSLFLIVLVLTNDLHQQVFCFRQFFYNWSDDYSYGWGYYVIWVWQYLLYLAALIAMIKRCRLTTSKNVFWVPIMPLVLGGLLLLGNINGFEVRLFSIRILNFPEIFCFMIALFWEGCIQIGLIPTNENYGKLFHRLTLPVWITSAFGETIYRSETAGELKKDQACTEGDILLDENTVLHGRAIPGGFGLWREDISEMNRVQRELTELNNRLMEESELIRLENRRREEQAHVDQQNALYDRIALMTRSQTQKIHALAQASEGADIEEQKRNAARICFYGAFIKRMSNLMLLSDGTNTSESGELFLSLAESMRYLQRTGVSCTLGNNIEFSCPADRLIDAYRFFQAILECNLDTLQGVYVTFQKKTDVSLRLMLDGATKLPSKDAESLPATYYLEDGTLFVKLLLKKGGDVL